jgi:hypothetical protein
MRHQSLGTWRIIEMEQWDQDYIDLVVPGYIAFREDHVGKFQFGTVHGEIDYRIEACAVAMRMPHVPITRWVVGRTMAS